MAAKRTSGLVAAGERLREDFELAQMGPRVTQNWENFVAHGDVSGTPAGWSDGPEAARARVINLVNNFFHDKLTGLPEIAEYMERVAAGG